VGQVVRDIQVLDPFLLERCSAAEIERYGRGATIASVDRRGKWVVFLLGHSRGLIVIQPRMTGGFWLVTPERPDHVRLTFLVDGSQKTIWFCDTRRLGKIAWYPDAEAADRAFSRSHGPDALTITSEELFARLTRTSRAVKPTLMDQKVLAGIGNIYADEVLFHARIHPTRIAASLTKREVTRIHTAIGQVLNAAILAEGSSFDAGYRTVLGLEGGFLAQNAMYGRGGQPCPACGQPIEKTRIPGLVGRPTHFCSHCQPISKPKPRPKIAKDS